MNSRLGRATPAPGAPESEALRRFRSFLCSALVRGEASAPALDGLELGERRVMALIDAWISAADSVHANGATPATFPIAPASPDSPDSPTPPTSPTAPTSPISAAPHPDADDGPVRAAVGPCIERFRLAVRTTGLGGRASKARSSVARRAVSAAIDRVSDAFLAIDTDSAEIVDANPAAGALLGVSRDALLGVDALSFVPPARRAGWRTQLDAMTEDGAARSFGARLNDALGGIVDVDATMTRFATRDRVLALLMVRPASLRGTQQDL